MLLDSNIIIYSSKREYAELRRFMAKNVYSVSAVSRIEVLGYHLLATEQHQYLIEFFQAADILRISDAVVTEAVKAQTDTSDRVGGCNRGSDSVGERAFFGHSQRIRLRLDRR